MVEAWAARLMFAEGERAGPAAGRPAAGTRRSSPRSRGLIQEGNLLEKGETPADAYMRVAGERYSVFHDHVWNTDVIDELGQRRR